MLHKHIEFFKRTMVEQQLDALACRQFSLEMLRLNALFATTKTGLRTASFEFFKDIFHRIFPGQQHRRIHRQLCW